MSIFSIVFYAFILGLLIIYYIVPQKYRWGVLLGGSVCFYLSNCSISLFLVMCAMSTLAYASALLSINYKKQWVIRTAIAVEFIVLFVLQLNAIFINNTNVISGILGIDYRITLPSWAVPLGISYYTLILVSYLLDVLWGIITPQKNLAKFLLFTSFFPQIISGPITRYKEMESTLFTGNKFNNVTITFGMQRILWGLFKKLVIAERLAVIVNAIYDGYEVSSGIYILVGMIGYTLQLYADFSGCMDIVIGTAQMFGVILPENFKTPFVSTNVSEVWRRWHMTLGFWVKDYLMYPILKSSFSQKLGKYCKKKYGKKLGKNIPTYVGLVCTWFFVGLWHGGTWNYILGSGLFFFVMIVGGQLLDPIFQKCIKLLRINKETIIWIFFSRIRTFLLFTFSISFGRAGSTMKGIDMWKKMFKPSELGLDIYLNPLISQPLNRELLSDLNDAVLQQFNIDIFDIFALSVALVILLALYVLQQKIHIREKLATQPLVWRWCIFLALICSIILFGFYGPGYNPADFIYAGF